MLAALATAAVPTLRPVGVRKTSVPEPDVVAVEIEDHQGNRWTTREPQTEAAATALDRELEVWHQLTTSTVPELPFRVPQLAGRAPGRHGFEVAIHQQMVGTPIDITSLEPLDDLVGAIAHGVATLHTVPAALMKSANLPHFSPEDYRQRRLDEVHRAASTGYVPNQLLARWELALEDPKRWRFIPCLTHGDLVSDYVLTSGGRLQAIISWSEARVADPADDLAWVLSGAPESTALRFLDVYRTATGVEDEHLSFRARLAAELSIARYLLHGATSGQETVISEARDMLADLAEEVQSIG